MRPTAATIPIVAMSQQTMKIRVGCHVRRGGAGAVADTRRGGVLRSGCGSVLVFLWKAQVLAAFVVAVLALVVM